MQQPNKPRKKKYDWEFFYPNEKPPVVSRRLKYVDRFLIGGVFLAISSVLFRAGYLYIVDIQDNSTRPEVVTFCARYRGIAVDEVSHFRGIPYAVAPQTPNRVIQKVFKHFMDIDSLRWRAPVPLDNIEACYAAHRLLPCQFNMSRWICEMTKFRDHCYRQMQKTESKSKAKEHGISADCLYLGISVPGSIIYPKKKLPVVVIIGGSHFLTDVSERLGNNFAFHPKSSFVKDIKAVVVTVQYRLGIMGTFFPDTTALNATNFSLLDQITALNWIQINIAKFGGDPAQIVLLGHGSGATSALALIAWQKVNRQSSHLLFHRAWLASGSAHVPKDKGEFQDLWKVGGSTVNLNCKVDSVFHQHCRNPEEFSKLRTKSIKDLYIVLAKMIDIENITLPLVTMEAFVDKQRQTPFLIIDNYTVFDSPLNQASVGQLSDIPIVFSSVASEFDGYPGNRIWKQKRLIKIKKDLKDIFLSVLINASVNSDIILETFQRKARQENKLLSTVALEILSLLRVTCPYFHLRYLLQKNIMHTSPVYQILQTEPALIGVRGMLFSNEIKRDAFHGFDLLVLLKRIDLYMQNPDDNTVSYQKHIMEAFSDFTLNGKLKWTSEMVTMDHNGIQVVNEKNPIFKLCSTVQFNKAALDFLPKIN